MANRIYLCGTQEEHIYPSFCEESYDASEQTLATDVYCIPLLWIALFRSDDIKAEVFEVEGQSIPAFAPVAEKEKVIGQIRDATLFLDSIFKGLGSIQVHATMLRALIESSPYKYVTVEWEEIVSLYPEGIFEREIKKAIYAIENQRSVSKSILGRLFSGDQLGKLLYELSSIKKQSKIPAADSFLKDVDLTDDEIWNLVRVFGTSHIRKVPWE